jgi:Glycosyl hydrolase catalytic core
MAVPGAARSALTIAGRGTRRLALVAVALLLVGGLSATALSASPSAPARKNSRGMLVGIQDDAQVLSDPAKAFELFHTLRAQVVRVGLIWGGTAGVARHRPDKATDPDDPAYRWTEYDKVVKEAAKEKIKLLFTIYGTPGWANGGKAAKYAPKNPGDLQNFAYAAAKRYSGTFKDADGTVLPAVRLWLAWNEPNSPTFLVPQFRRVGRHFVVQSARDYVKICTAIYNGVHRTGLAGEKVACGATSPRGNNAARQSRPSVSPLVFLQDLKKFGLRRFDAYAHHPYYGRPTETPTTRPKARTTVTLANINVLLAELKRLYGAKPLWITEYGYQTRPPDSLFGVPWAKQARYLRQAYSIARKNRRIQMMIWFLVRDEPRLGGWQSGLMTAAGKKKPSYVAFERLPH